jgi:uncharacterized protein YyaL (SSP411 family)
MALTTLLKLVGFTNELRYVDIAYQALAYAQSKPREIAIVGDPDSVDTEALLDVVRDGYLPFQVVALGAPSSQLPDVPLLRDRGLVSAQAAAYVCRDFACQAPATEPAALRQLLEQQ